MLLFYLSKIVFMSLKILKTKEEPALSDEINDSNLCITTDAPKAACPHLSLFHWVLFTLRSSTMRQWSWRISMIACKGPTEPKNMRIRKTCWHQESWSFVFGASSFLSPRDSMWQHSLILLCLQRRRISGDCQRGLHCCLWTLPCMKSNGQRGLLIGR